MGIQIQNGLDRVRSVESGVVQFGRSLKKILANVKVDDGKIAFCCPVVRNDGNPLAPLKIIPTATDTPSTSNHSPIPFPATEAA